MFGLSLGFLSGAVLVFALVVEGVYLLFKWQLKRRKQQREQTRGGPAA